MNSEQVPAGIAVEDRAATPESVQRLVVDVLETIERLQRRITEKDGTIDKVLYIDSIRHPGKASLNSHLLVFRSLQDNYISKYLYSQLTSKRFKDFVELSKSGTAFFGLSQASVGKYPVLLPSPAEQTPSSPSSPTWTPRSPRWR